MTDDVQPGHSGQCCRNCGAQLPAKAFFCPHCGQRNTDGRITFGELASHFMANLLNFDGRIFQTMAALFVPGKLTRNFFEGKHVRYYHPVRLFILSGALFIAMLSIITSKADIGDIDRIWKNRETAYVTKGVIMEVDTLGLEITKEFGEPVVSVAMDTLNTRLKNKFNYITEDSVEITDVINFGGGSEQSGKKIALSDLINMREDALANKYGITGLWERQIFLQNIRIQKSLKSFLFYMIGNILWMVLIMMPMLAFALKLLYIRHPYLYIEHLIFSFHTHTFLFIFYSLLFFIGIWAGYEWLNWALIIVAIYLLLAMKKFYKQKWGKIILKFLIVSVLYFGIMLLAMITITAASVFLF